MLVTTAESKERTSTRAIGGRSAGRRIIRFLAGALVSFSALWAAGAIYYAPIPGEHLHAALAALWLIATALAFAFVRPVGRALGGYLIAFAALVALWFQIPASNDRDWQPEVSVTPYATITGELITIHGVRNFDYRTETDFMPRWETRTYDLRKLDSVDLIAVYWAGKAIAHIMVSFGFAGKDYVTVSIETRKERGENYSTLAGFFRQYELVYVVADDRDVIGVRTTYRQPQEDVYVYRVKAPLANIRRALSRLCENHERHARAAALLQYADDQLHDDHSHAHASKSRVAADVVENFVERLRAGVSLRVGQARRQPAVR